MLVELLLVGVGVAAGWVLKSLLSHPPSPMPEACHAVHHGHGKRCLEPLGHRDPHRCEILVGAFFEPMAARPTPLTKTVYWDNKETTDEACASHTDGG